MTYLSQLELAFGSYSGNSIPEMTLETALDSCPLRGDALTSWESVVITEQRKVNSAVVYRLGMRGLKRQSLVSQYPLG
jgi:hypothetical protein